jgi:hypothetical protein
MNASRRLGGSWLANVMHDNVQEMEAAGEKLGHHDGSARAVYEHPTSEMRHRMLTGLQAQCEAWQAETVIHSQATPGGLFEYAGIPPTH